MNIAAQPLPQDWPFPPTPTLAVVEGRRTLALKGFEGVWEGAWVEGLALEGPSGGLEGAHGRGGIFRVGEVVVRPYRRGGLLGHLVRRTYLQGGRFAQEFQVHRHLWEAGFPTVMPLGYLRRRVGLGWQGLYLTRLQPEVLPWPRCFHTPGVGAQVARLMHWLCRWQLWSPDLNATNVMVESPDLVYLLDWDRAMWDLSTDLEDRYLKRMNRSLVKMGARDLTLTSLQP